jgi:hypothetical protein
VLGGRPALGNFATGRLAGRSDRYQSTLRPGARFKMLG